MDVKLIVCNCEIYLCVVESGHLQLHTASAHDPTGPSDVDYCLGRRIGQPLLIRPLGSAAIVQTNAGIIFENMARKALTDIVTCASLSPLPRN
jgi:hypothetical protein